MFQTIHDTSLKQTHKRHTFTHEEKYEAYYLRLGAYHLQQTQDSIFIEFSSASLDKY
jgi:hypothetical protein